MSSNVFVHPNALVETNAIGNGTRVWAFAHVLPNVVIGQDCNIGDHCFIESGVRLGDKVTLKNGVSVWEGVTVDDKVFVGPNVAFTNDLYPRSKVYLKAARETRVCEGASIGANATIVSGVRLGKYCLIGAGAVVTRDVADFELVYGNPAKHKGWVGIDGSPLTFIDNAAAVNGQHYSLTPDQKVILL
jgi:acetyltransferase-like isoleucine patch superfamily enzyme